MKKTITTTLILLLYNSTSLHAAETKQPNPEPLATEQIIKDWIDNQ